MIPYTQPPAIVQPKPSPSLHTAHRTYRASDIEVYSIIISILYCSENPNQTARIYSNVDQKWFEVPCSTALGEYAKGHYTF